MTRIGSNWLSALAPDEQADFFQEYAAALCASEVTGPEAVEELLYDWQQTARIWADEELREELMTDIETPLRPRRL